MTEGAARGETRSLLVVTLAIGLTAAAYLLFLGHRTDYAGHLLAGYGATLGALGLALVVTPSRLIAGSLGVLVVVGTIACIGFGLVLEDRVFRIAIFDPVDALNQSLGATLAGLSTLAVSGPGRPSPAIVVFGVLLSVATTIAGFLLAFH